MIKRPFEQWEFEDVETEFGITRVKNLPLLVDWLNVPNMPIITSFQEELRLSITQNIEMWNTSELETLFLAPFLDAFDFNSLPNYRIFMNRPFTLQTPKPSEKNAIQLFISQGKQKPKPLFWFVQKYRGEYIDKKEEKIEADILGQLLLAMIDLQQQNNSPQKPLYGCYTLGRFWFFVALVGKEYGVSRAYDATQADDMNAMVYILERVKQHIHQELNLPYNFPYGN